MLLCQTLAVDGCCVGLNVNLNAALAALLVWNPREQDANAEGVGRRDIDTPTRNMSRVMVVVKVKRTGPGSKNSLVLFQFQM